MDERRTYSFGGMDIEAFPVGGDASSGITISGELDPSTFSEAEDYDVFVNRLAAALVEAGIYVWSE